MGTKEPGKEKSSSDEEFWKKRNAVDPSETIFTQPNKGAGDWCTVAQAAGHSGRPPDSVANHVEAMDDDRSTDGKHVFQPNRIEY